MLSKNCKYEVENRIFYTKGEEEFFFVDRNGMPMYLLCQVTLSQFKTSNLKRHHDTNHSGFNKDFPVGFQLRKTKL